MEIKDLNKSLQELTQVIWASAILREAGRLAGNDVHGKPNSILPDQIETARDRLGWAWKAAVEDLGYGHWG